MKIILIGGLFVILCGVVYSKILPLPAEQGTTIAANLGSMANRLDPAVSATDRLSRLRNASTTPGRNAARSEAQNIRVSDYVMMHKTRSEQIP